jgi:proline iminopeptidase
MLAMQYALKYQNNMKALMVANMMASCPEYDRYADEVLAKQMDPQVLAEIRAIEAKNDFGNPRYMELLLPHFYRQHLCRLKEWPEAVMRSMKHANQEIYVMMQGPSEFGIGGRLAKWDVKDRLKEIKIPTLMIGAKHDRPNMTPWILRLWRNKASSFRADVIYTVQMAHTWLCGMIKKYSWRV